MKILQRFVGFLFVHRGIDDSRADGIKANASVRILNGKALGDRIDPTFAEVRPERVKALHGLHGQSSRDAYHMAAALLEHLLNDRLSNIKEAVGIGGHNCPVLLVGILMKVTWHKNSSVVYQQIDPP